MVEIKEVLFCTDFSENAKVALSYALELCKRFEARLHLIHVYQEPGDMPPFEIPSQTKMDWVRVVRNIGLETEKKLRALGDQVAQELPACHFSLRHGRPYLEIVRYAKENRVDLIVMASHGLSGWEQALFGSTTDRVLRESPCPVLVVRKTG